MLRENQNITASYSDTNGPLAMGLVVALWRVGGLTVGQSVLERVDAVQHNDT